MFILFEDICLYSLLVHLTGVAVVPNHWLLFFGSHRPLSPSSVTRSAITYDDGSS